LRQRGLSHDPRPCPRVLAGALVLAKVHSRHRHEWHYYDGNEYEGTEDACRCGAVRYVSGDDIDWLVEYRTPSYSLN
jgi:hypothetical protein